MLAEIDLATLYALGGISEGKIVEIAGVSWWDMSEILENAGFKFRHRPQIIEGDGRDAGLIDTDE